MCQSGLIGMARRLSAAGFKNVKKKIGSAMGVSKNDRANRSFDFCEDEGKLTEETKEELDIKLKRADDRRFKLRSESSCSDEDDLTTPITFLVQYLGFVELKLPGFTEICETVSTMYTSAKPKLKTLERSLLTLSKDGICLRGSDVEASSVGEQYKPRRILYCGVDKQHQKVFSFNYQFGPRAENIHLHVVVCKTKEDAKCVAKRLAGVFKQISKEMHQREKEDKAKHSEGINKLKSTTSNSSIQSYSNIRFPSSASNSVDSNKGDSFLSNGDAPVRSNSGTMSHVSVT